VDTNSLSVNEWCSLDKFCSSSFVAWLIFGLVSELAICCVCCGSFCFASPLASPFCCCPSSVASRPSFSSAAFSSGFFGCGGLLPAMLFTTWWLSCVCSFAASTRACLILPSTTHLSLLRLASPVRLWSIFLMMGVLLTSSSTRKPRVIALLSVLNAAKDFVSSSSQTSVFLPCLAHKNNLRISE